jgi:hypothetical protein
VRPEVVEDHHVLEAALFFSNMSFANELLNATVGVEVDTKYGDCADPVALDLQSNSELPQESGTCVPARYVLAQ